MSAPTKEASSGANVRDTTTADNNNHHNMLLRLENLENAIAQFSDGHCSSSNEAPQQQEEASLLKRFAPPGLEKEFQQLLGVVSGGTATARNTSAAAAAILMGPRGSGKSLLLERCVEALKVQQQASNGSIKLPRQVVIHGILSKGHNVGTVIYEIIRQLSEIAFVEGSSDDTVETNDTANATDNSNDDPELQQRKRKRRRRHQHDKHLLRLRQNSNFTSNLQLLEEVLKIADADGVPILLVLDELEAFLSTTETTDSNHKQVSSSTTTTRSHHQLLLYLLLDRVATPGSNLILVMMTSSFSCLIQLEKRIRSRAEGTCQVIYTSVGKTYQELVDSVLQRKLKGCAVGKEILARVSYKENGNGGDNSTNTSSTVTVIPEAERQQAIQISSAMERQFRLGKDVRWFSRVLSTTLALYRQEVVMVAGATSSAPSFHCKHIHTALVMMGATSIGSDVTTTTSSSTGTTAATRQPDFCTVTDDAYSITTAVDPRLQSLLDLSIPQLALLLAAKRILTRQSHASGNGREGDNSNRGSKKDTSSSLPAPVTIDRMMQEYESFRRKSSSGAAYSKSLLKKAALHLLQVGLIVPIENANHSVANPALYYRKGVTKSYQNMDTVTLLTKLPLQIPLEMSREFAKALQGDVLQCPTALKEWGKAAV